MKNNSLRVISSTVIAFVISSCSILNHNKTNAYVPVDKALYNMIYIQDSVLFDAFNSRDFEKFKSFFSDKLEIYQDNIGVRDHNQSMEAFQRLFQGNYVLTRKLVLKTLEIYPVKDYGAIETGQHTFCHVENGKLDCGTFKFVHIWENHDGDWKIVRIITYNH
jgi:hypothetical protein